MFSVSEIKFLCIYGTIHASTAAAGVINLSTEKTANILEINSLTEMTELCLTVECNEKIQLVKLLGVFSSFSKGRAIAQAVSRWLPITAVRVRARVSSSGICGEQSGAGAGFLRVFRFPLPIFIPPNFPPSQSPGAGTIGQKRPTCRVDPVWTAPPTMRIKKEVF
jgi:hypothetical protein